MKNKMLIFVTVIATLFFSYSVFYFTNTVSAERTGRIVPCSAIGDFNIAQRDLALYKAHPGQYPQFSHLDGDGDGIACELLKIKKL